MASPSEYKYSSLPVEDHDDVESGRAAGTSDAALDAMILSAKRIEDMSLTISNEMHLQGMEIEDLDLANEELQHESGRLSVSARESARAAERDANIWCAVLILLVIAIVVVLAVKLRR